MTGDAMIGDEALSLAARGIPVLPLFPVEPDRSCACGNPHCSSVGKHPIRDLAPNGLHNATVDGGALREWWALWPDANIGVRTGAVSGLIALDIDDKGGGWSTVASLEDEHGPLPVTWAVATGGGGGHLYFRHPGGRVGSSAGKLGPGLDIRGDDAYCVAPPSFHRSGEQYYWSKTLHPDLVPLAEAPAWLLEHILTSADTEGPKIVEGEPIVEGKLNTRLFRLGSAMRRYGLSDAAIAASLLVTNQECCKPPLDDQEVWKIARSAGRYAPEPSVKLFVLASGAQLTSIRGGGRRRGR